MSLGRLGVALPPVNLYLDPLRAGSIQTSIDVTQLTPECEAWARQNYDFLKYNMLASQASALAAQNPNPHYRFYRDATRASEAGLYERYYISRDDRDTYLHQAADFMFQSGEILRQLGAAINLPSFWLTFEAQTLTFPKGPTVGLPWPRIGPARTITDLVHGAGLPTSWGNGADRVMENVWVQGFSVLPLYDPAVQSDPYWGSGGAWGDWSYAAGMTAPGLVTVWRDMRVDASGRDFPYLAVRTHTGFVESWRPAMGPRLSCEYAANLLRYAAGQSGPGLLKTSWQKWAGFVRRAAAITPPSGSDSTLDAVNTAAAVVDAAGSAALAAGTSSANPYLIVGGAAAKAGAALARLTSTAIPPSCLELPQRSHYRRDLLGLLCPPVEPFLTLPASDCVIGTTSTPGGDRGSGWTQPAGWRAPPPPPPEKSSSSVGWYIGAGLALTAVFVALVAKK